MTDFDIEGQVGILVGQDSREESFANERYDALFFAVSHHGVAFAAACLSVGKHADVEALESVLEEVLAQIVI